MNLKEKLKEPKNKLRVFSFSLYIILFAAWFALDFKILYLVMGLFIILVVKVLYAYDLAMEIKINAKAKKIKTKKKKT